MALKFIKRGNYKRFIDHYNAENSQDEENSALLYEAIKFSRIDIVKFLLTKPINKDYYNTTSRLSKKYPKLLDIALFKRFRSDYNADIIHLLLQANITNMSRFTFEKMAKYNAIDLFDILDMYRPSDIIENFKYFLYNNTKKCIVHYVRKYWDNIPNIIIKYGDDLNFDILAYYIRENAWRGFDHSEIINLLLSHPYLRNKVEINQTYKGNTMMHYAAKYQVKYIIEILYNYGADPTKVNNEGLTPRQCMNEGYSYNGLDTLRDYLRQLEDEWNSFSLIKGT